MSLFDSSRAVGATRGVLVATYDTYGEAQRAVDRLPHARFPVEHVQIIGRAGA
jgi:hypothetical protein